MADIGSQCIANIEGYRDYFTAMVGNSKETSEDWGILEVGFSKADKPVEATDSYGLVIGLVSLLYNFFFYVIDEVTN